MKRFVTYIYAYEEGQKKNNVGFAKVEIRGENCRMEVHLRGIYSSSGSCQVYLMKQEAAEITGFPLGEMKIVSGGGDFGSVFPAGEIAGSSYGMYDMDGLFLRSDNDEIFVSRWKDGGNQNVRNRDFHVWIPKPEESVAQEPEGCGVPEEGGVQKPEGNRIPEGEDAPAAVKTMTAAHEGNRIPEAGDAQKPKVSVQEPEKNSIPEQMAATEEADEKETDAQEMQEEENLSATELPMRNIFPRHDWTVVWEKLKKNHLRFAPFADETILCIQIDLRDLRELPKRYWYFGNNSFLLHGFFNYHYLVLGNVENTRWFIGIPGIYQRQECAMAAIFGFPEFLPVAVKDETDMTGEPVNRFGYWYRFIEE